MAPGAFSVLAPLLGRSKGKSSKYEKLETDDPERKRHEATQDEINRLNFKIVSTNYVTIQQSGFYVVRRGDF
jgi:hypothetical protein